MIAMQQVDNVHQEVACLRALGGHPLICTLLGTSQDSRALYLLSEYAGGGDLEQALLRHGPLQTVEALRFYMSELFAAIAFAHSVGYVLRDVKPANVLLSTGASNRSSSSNGHCLLTDFGFAKLLDPATEYRAHTICGTPDYMAPE
eukprot:SAG31_NODE_26764_length_437_cov_0.544379_1_plen_145_part_11